LRQQLLAHRRKRARGVPKTSTVAIYASIFAIIVAVIAIGYRPPQETTGVVNATPITTNTQSEPTSIDQVVASTVAAKLAETTKLSVAPNVAEFAVSEQTKSEFLQSDTTAITKPQILQPGAENRAVVSYTTKAGDTVDTIAASYGISVDTLKWANNLTTNTVAEGRALTILPIDGIQYTVKTGDTLQSIGEKYTVDQTRIVLYNDLDVSGITAGQKIILPGANLPTTERPGYVAPVTITAAATTFLTGYSSGFGGGATWRIKVGTPNAGNYAFGNCTAYAFDRSAEFGKAIGKRWGNAGSWAAAARADGFRVDRSPAAGAIVQDSGHVAIVEEVLANGDLRLSEMNAYVTGGGWNLVSGRILPAAFVGQYLYIH